MISNFSFMLMSFFFLLILLVYFLSKEHIKTKELVLYKGLLISNLVGLFMEMLCSISIKFFVKGSLFTLVINKVYLLYFIIFLTLLSVYTYLIAEGSEKFNKHYSRIKRICTLVFVSAAILVAVLKINFNYGDVAYSYGPAVDIIYAYSFAGVGLCIILMLKNIKTIKSQKYLPLIIYIVGSGFVAIIQRLYPELTLSTTMDAIVLFIMYFTIENPDLRMLNEVYKNKELMEQNYEDKYNFLFEMTQETRNPLLNINRVYNEIRDSNNPDDVKKGLLVVSNLAKQLDFTINNILNISSLDAQKIKIIETKYNLNKFCEDLELRIKNEVKEGVDLSFEVPGNCPTLYGDYMKLRQILFSLLSNACKNTEKGSIILSVNLIEKYDVCRVIFKLSDTGKGIPIEEINEILSATGELDKNELESLVKNKFNIKVCQKVIKIMGGHLMIKSDEKSGTDITLTIDQRVYHEKENSLLAQYEREVSNYKNVLLVCQDQKLISFIKRKLGEANIVCSNLMYGMDAVDKIKSGKRYDYILIEDEMQEVNGFITMQELMKIQGFNTPCIVLLKSDKENIKEHYLEDGFPSYIMIHDLDEELDNIINKY